MDNDDIWKIVGCLLRMVIIAIGYYVAYRLLMPVMHELLPDVSDSSVSCISVIVVIVVASLMRIAAKGRS